MMHKCKLTVLKTMLNEEHKDMAICSCNDRLRPMIIKIERTDEVSEA